MAIPAWEFVPLIPTPLRSEPFFHNITRLPVAPAIAVQIWFDRKVIPTKDFVLVARSVVPVYQEQSSIYKDTQGDRISVTISPADAYLSYTDAVLTQLVIDELSQVEAGIQEAGILKSVVLRHE